MTLASKSQVAEPPTTWEKKKLKLNSVAWRSLWRRQPEPYFLWSSIQTQTIQPSGNIWQHQYLWDHWAVPVSSILYFEALLKCRRNRKLVTRKRETDFTLRNRSVLDQHKSPHIPAIALWIVSTMPAGASTSLLAGNARCSAYLKPCPKPTEKAF